MTTARRGWAGTGSTTRWRAIRPVILARDGYTCQIQGPRCTGTATTVDHITALADGGAMYDPTNLRAACQTCNCGRRDTSRATGDTAIETRTRW
jgi:5-methylcytosine-specific restriction endonuclease McrA